jgi:hypothetical protein
MHLQGWQTLGEARRGSERSDRPSLAKPRAGNAGVAVTDLLYDRKNLLILFNSYFINLLYHIFWSLKCTYKSKFYKNNVLL